MAYNAVTVTDTATLILAANPNRISYFIVNNGSNTIYIGSDTSITTVNALPITPGANVDEDSGGTKMYMGPIYGIAGVAQSSDIRYWERSETR